MNNQPPDLGWTADLGELGFCITFSRSRAPREILSSYRADARRAQLLTRPEALSLYVPGMGGTLLRAGTLGTWGFCFEELGIEGSKPGVLRRLSSGTETISLCYTADGTSIVKHLNDGRLIEKFEPGSPHTAWAEGPLRLARHTQELINEMAGRVNRKEAALHVTGQYVGHYLDRSTLEGKLLTAFLLDADCEPLQITARHHAKERLGRRLAALQPQQPPRDLGNHRA
jgi:hypothetical protein